MATLTIQIKEDTIMPLTWLKCPDTQLITVDDCLAKCRMGRRCLTLPTLKEITSEREWKGEPSTTQLINGTMMEFLKLTQPYTIDPDDRAFALLGTRHHQKLEAQSGPLAELALSGDRDIIDLLECEEGAWTLTDYKTWGSYRVAKALGMVQVGKRPDPNGEVYKTSGKWGKAGDVKTVPVFQPSGPKDMKDTELQLNHYRVMLKDKFNILIDRMQIQITVRDGGLAVATGRGITRNTYMLDVDKLDDGAVTEFFSNKKEQLLRALRLNEWTEPCTDWECWDGTRCKGYCDVAVVCPKGLRLNG